MALTEVGTKQQCLQSDPTYPRVLPASLPRVSEPERNHGESLVLPGLDVLPAPELLLLSFDLGKNQERTSHKTARAAGGRHLQTCPLQPPVESIHLPDSLAPPY